jgi:hypothetical protein
MNYTHSMIPAGQGINMITSANRTSEDSLMLNDEGEI